MRKVTKSAALRVITPSRLGNAHQAASPARVRAGSWRLSFMRLSIAALFLAVFELSCAHLPSPSSIETGSSSISRCPKCGAALFFAVPGVTTKDEIREFALHSKLPDKDQIAKDGWIHPGAYCSNGCYEVYYTFR